MSFDPSIKEQKRFHGYGKSPIPSQLDAEIDDFVDGLMTGGTKAVERASTSLTLSSRRVLRVYAERMASASIRRNEPSLLVRALVALVLGGLEKNERESLMVMAPIEHSAGRLGVEFDLLCEEASKVVGAPGSVNLVRWLMRKPDDRTLKAMRYSESKDSDGFRYVWSW